MVRKGDFVMREVAGEVLLIPVGETALQFNGMITLNAVSKVIWEALEKPVTYAEVLQAVLDHFDVNEEEAAADLEQFLREMKEADLLEGDLLISDI